MSEPHNVIAFHGYCCSPRKKILKDVESLCEKEGIKYFAPEFPSEDYSFEAWMKIYDSFKDKINENTILLGYSLGAALLLNILSQIEKPVHASVLIAGYGTEFGEGDMRESRSGFVKNLSWEAINKNKGITKIFASTNDSKVPQDVSDDLGQRLETSVEYIENAGHFRYSEGFTDFPELIDYLKSLIQKEND